MLSQSSFPSECVSGGTSRKRLEMFFLVTAPLKEDRVGLEKLEPVEWRPAWSPSWPALEPNYEVPGPLLVPSAASRPKTAACTKSSESAKGDISTIQGGSPRAPDADLAVHISCLLLS